MRLAGSRVYVNPAPVPTMPPGLVEIMEGLAKDVLKNNPEDIYEFCAGHMQKLLEIRDGPPPSKKQLSLEQKIAKAQEKIRQRIRDRQNQHLSVHSSHNQEHQNKQHVDIPLQNLDSQIQPVIHAEELVMANEVEILYGSNVDLTNNEITTVEDKIKKDKAQTQEAEENELTEKMHGEVTEKASDNIKPVLENAIAVDDIIGEYATQTVESKASVKNIIKEIREHPFDNPPEMSEVEVIVAMDNDVIEDIDKQSLERKKPIENVIGDNTRQIPDIVDKDNAVQSSREPKSKDNVESQQKENDQIQLVESENFDTKIDSNTEEKTVTLDQEPIEREISLPELDELTFVQPLPNNSETELSHNDDNENVQMKHVTEEDEIINKEVLTENKIHNIKPEEPASPIYSNVKQNTDGLLHAPNDTAAEEVSNNQLSPYQTETQLESQIERSLNTEAPDIKPDLPIVDLLDSVKLEDEVITVEIAERATAKVEKNSNYKEDLDKDDHINEINSVTDKEQQSINTYDKLPEQERAFFGEFEVRQKDMGDDTNPVYKVLENYESTKNTAVNGMDLETAAITIQKVFRTFLFSKSRASTLDDTLNENSLDEDIQKKDEPEYVLPSTNLNKERRTLGISRMDTVLQTVNEEKSLSISDESTLSSAATTIQAHVRGFLVRNRLASNKTASSSSLVNSDGPSTVSLDGDGNEQKKTILNIHIVPERGQFMSRDESLLTSIDLPLDNSPLSSINLHPLGYDKSERRKQLKREDAVQSISPPSNNSGKLSDDVDSVKDVPNHSIDFKQESESVSKNGHDNDTNNIQLDHKSIFEGDHDVRQEVDTEKHENDNISVNSHDKPQDDTESCETTLTISSTAETVLDAEIYSNREVLSSPEHNLKADRGHEVVTNSSSDEMDVVTPFPTIPEKAANTESDDRPKLVHSGEFHDLVVQTQVKRTESSVVREFKNVLVYFLLWDKT